MAHPDYEWRPPSARGRWALRWDDPSRDSSEQQDNDSELPLIPGAEEPYHLSGPSRNSRFGDGGGSFDGSFGVGWGLASRGGLRRKRGLSTSGEVSKPDVDGLGND
ncbi:hypothetical protein TWF281_006770 [Arthrobotrys megalospora]